MTTDSVLLHDDPAQPGPGHHYLDLLYGVFFHPVTTFRTLAEPDESLLPMFFALLTVIGISALQPVIRVLHLGGHPSELVIPVIVSAVLGVMMWLFMGTVLSLLGYAFLGQTRLRPLLLLTGFATLPWLLMVPMGLFKVGIGSLGVMISVSASLVIWLWTVLLFALALMVTYKLTVERVLIVLGAPFLLTLVSLAWLIGFFNKLGLLNAIK